MAYTVFEYLYRDASNYKAFGSVCLRGELSAVQCDQLMQCLEAGEFFVAEQVGIPPAYDQLFQLSSGPTAQDHAWHSFYRLRTQETSPSNVTVWGDVAQLLDAFSSAASNWMPALSPNFMLA